MYIIHLYKYMPCLFQYVQPHVINKSMFSMLRIRKNTHQLFDNHRSSQPTQYAKPVYCLEGLKRSPFIQIKLRLEEESLYRT